MITNIINGGNHRYLSELPEFQNGLPFGVINKTKSDVGGTYVAANCNSNYIIVCPFRDLVNSIAADKNNQYEIFKLYCGVSRPEFTAYLNRTTIHKVAVTYDSFPKLTEWIGDVTGWKVLVDEYHLLLEDFGFRDSAITNLFKVLEQYDYYSFLSATPIADKVEIPFLKDLPHYTVTWDGKQIIQPFRFKVAKVSNMLANLINIFLNEGLGLPAIDGEVREVEQLYIFLNSVTSIKQILDSLKLDPADVKICCADTLLNRKTLSANKIRYNIASVTDPSRKINFFTKKAFQGCNLFSNNGLIIVASDAQRLHTIADIFTTIPQIIGRLRENNDYHNIFRNVIIHIYATNSCIESDGEFNDWLTKLRNESIDLLDIYNNANDRQKATFISRFQKTLDESLLSIDEGKLYYNHLKESAFIQKHQLRDQYRDGLTIYDAYKHSDQLEAIPAYKWERFEVKMKRAATVSYAQLLDEYLAHPSDAFEQAYPEFKEILSYLTPSEIHRCGHNKDKMLKMVDDKKELDVVFRAIQPEKESFFSLKSLKDLIGAEFRKRGILLAPKASLIKKCTLYRAKKIEKNINGFRVRGYVLPPRPLPIHLGYAGKEVVIL